MANFPRHSPLPWKFVRGESIVSKRRREVTQQMRKAIDESRAPSNGLWFDQQRHVVQVVPSEMADPKTFDNFNYSYQVYARLPPIQSEPRSLAEVTDEPPPIRYNVKRVAVDQPCRPNVWECAAHWSQQPWVLKEANNSNYDTSQNNDNAASVPTGKDPRDGNNVWPQGKQTKEKPVAEFTKPCAPCGSASGSSCSGSSCSSAQLVTGNPGRSDLRNCNNSHCQAVHKVLATNTPASPAGGVEDDRVLSTSDRVHPDQELDHPRQDVFLDISVMLLNKSPTSGELFSAHHCSPGEKIPVYDYDLDMRTEQKAPENEFSYCPVSNQCTNNNAMARRQEKPGVFHLHCYQAEDKAGQSQRGGLRVCRPVKRYPSLPRDKVMKGEVIKSKEADGDPSLLPKLQCKVVPRCAGLYDPNAARKDEVDPLLVCEEEKPEKVQPAYGTYKIIMGQPYRHAPPPDYYSDIKLPPHLEEYREFQRRCPNLRYGRYDRTDPAYDMLLPANKDSSLLKGGASPFTYTKDPKRGKSWSLFHVKQDPTKDLHWSLPSGMHK